MSIAFRKVLGILTLLLVPALAYLITTIRFQLTRAATSPASARMSTRAPVIALTHGGGPLPLLGEPSHKDIIRSLTQRVPALLKLDTPDAPRAIVLVTAHWSEKNPTISSAAQHSLYYDYYGFPKETYELQYPAPGSPEIAKEVAQALRGQGLSPQLDDARGWDHGVFVPMLLINPKADVPVIQLSVLSSEDPADHFAMGRALRSLRDSNIAVVGSGFASIHNLRAMRDGSMQTPGFVSRNKEWSRILGEAVTEEDAQLREARLETWRSFPNSYEMHPRNGGEHFMPLLVCAAAGGQGKAKQYADELRGIDVWSYYWD